MVILVEPLKLIGTQMEMHISIIFLKTVSYSFQRVILLLFWLPLRVEISILYLLVFVLQFLLGFPYVMFAVGIILLTFLSQFIDLIFLQI